MTETDTPFADEPDDPDDRSGAYWALTELLLDRLKHLDRLSDRLQIIGELRRDGIRLQVEEDPRALFHVHAMVAGCDQYPDGLKRLVREASRGYEGTTGAHAATLFLQMNFPEPLLSSVQRASLIRLLGRHPGIRELYRYARRHLEQIPPRRGPGGPTDLERLLAVLENEVEIAQRPHPLMVFVEVAAALADTALRRELHAWNDLTGPQLHWPAEQMEEERDRAEIRAGMSDEESCLLVRISSRPASPENFHIEAWLVHGDTPDLKVYFSKQAKSLELLHQRFNQLHEKAIEDLAIAAPGLRVEFLLPLHLIWMPVDQIEIRPLQAFPRALGEEREVVVRSSERQVRLQWHAALERRWRWLQTHAEHGLDGAVEWLEAGQPVDRAALLARLRNSSDIPVCFVLFEPPQHTGELADNYLSVLLEQGIPVVVAIRQAVRREEARRMVESLLRGALNDLPGRVRVLRGGLQVPGMNGEAPPIPDLHRHVSLLWENPAGLRRTTVLLAQPKRRGAGV